MDTQQTDILISGGGIAGLCAAAAFGSAGFSVVCVDPTPPITEASAPGADLRTTAFLQPAQALLEEAGLWARLAPHAAPLFTMRIMDVSGATTARDFNAADLGAAPFGWNLPNWLLRREILARLTELPNVDFRPGVSSSALFTRTDEARVTLSDGSKIRARLVIAADGRASPMRASAGIGVQTTRFGQKALAFAVTHARPHENVSTEIHRRGGPCTLVPLPDRDGQPCSAVVWMDAGPEVSRRLALSPAAFETELNDRASEALGPLRLASRLTAWPIIAQIAERFSAERLALIAEAAHVVPPIGAQGLNMSLADIRALLDLARAAPADLGSAAMLARYDRARYGDVKTRVTGIIALNKASQAGGEITTRLRALGVGLLHDLAPLRKTLMRAGLGAK